MTQLITKSPGHARIHDKAIQPSRAALLVVNGFVVLGGGDVEVLAFVVERVPGRLGPTDGGLGALSIHHSANGVGHPEPTTVFKIASDPRPAPFAFVIHA